MESSYRTMDVSVVDSGALLGLNVVFSLITYSLIAKFYIMPRFRQVNFADGVVPMLLLHTTRHVGMFFLAPGVVKKKLPEQFAVPAAYGDLLAAVLAFIAIYGLRARSGWAKAAVWLFNIEGFVDLLNAITQGFKVRAQEHFGAAMWIPAVIVPALLVTHALIFILLLRDEKPVDKIGKHKD